MEKHRCGWCKGDALYEAYHDLEWGVSVTDDQKLFEFLLLETFQAGLSWITILKKERTFAAPSTILILRKSPGMVQINTKLCWPMRESFETV